MTTSLMILQAVVSVFLIITVLLQFGKGAEAGLLGGGASDSVFTGAQKGNILSKITVFLSVVFLANSVLLSKIQSDKSGSSLLESSATPAPLSLGDPPPTTKTKGEQKGKDTATKK